jgi:hypothetical protein
MVLVIIAKFGFFGVLQMTQIKSVIRLFSYSGLR